MESRTKNSARNAAMGVLTYIVTLVLQMINRTVFIHILSTEYLGLNGLFSNILSMLSLSELGIGSAIIYSLYKPIADRNFEKIKSLMRLYKKIYTAIGVFILIVGVILTPFLKFLIKDMPDMPFIHIYFVLYVIDTGISYFYTYKRSLIICNQEEYISSLTQTVKGIGTKVLQIVVLLLTHNFMLYLVIQIICTRIENVAISKIADKKYPYLKEKDVLPLDKSDIKEIKKNAGAMVFHKVGEVLVNATDNIIISKILGLNIVGLISNYTLIISSISSLTSKIMNSMIASVGNLLTDSNIEKAKEVFKRILFMNFFIMGFCFVCLTTLLQDFVKLWVGEKYLMPIEVVFIYTLYFYIAGMRRTVLIFRDARGLFWQDRYKAIVESIVNLAVSIPLTLKFGAAGVRAGTIVSCLVVAFWIEALVLYKNYFKHGLLKYFCVQILYIVITLGTYFTVNYLLDLLSFGEGWGAFFIKTFECVILTIIIFSVIFCRSSSFKYYLNMIKQMVKKKR